MWRHRLSTHLPLSQTVIPSRTPSSVTYFMDGLLLVFLLNISAEHTRDLWIPVTLVIFIVALFVLANVSYEIVLKEILIVSMWVCLQLFLNSFTDSSCKQSNTLRGVHPPLSYEASPPYLRKSCSKKSRTNFLTTTFFPEKSLCIPRNFWWPFLIIDYNLEF